MRGLVMQHLGLSHHIDSSRCATAIGYVGKFKIHDFLNQRAQFPGNINHDQILAGFNIIVKTLNLVVFTGEAHHTAFPGAKAATQQSDDQYHPG